VTGKDLFLSRSVFDELGTDMGPKSGSSPGWAGPGRKPEAWQHPSQ
jgi:hypothetical protein